MPQIPWSPEGILKIPEGSTPCPRAGAEAGVRREAPNEGRSGGPRARRVARRIFKIPEGLRVSGEDSRTNNTIFGNIFFNTISKSHKRVTPYLTSEIQTFAKIITVY